MGAARCSRGARRVRWIGRRIPTEPTVPPSWLLRIGFRIAPILHGVDKFRHLLHVAFDGATVEAARLGGGSGQN
jgi:hypothetical protein